MDTKTNFKNFLIQKDYFEKYCLNLKKQKNKTFDEFISTQRGPLLGVINNSFTWYKALEGGDFWRNINDEWDSALMNKVIFNLKYRSIW